LGHGEQAEGLKDGSTVGIVGIGVLIFSVDLK
jgi:hypothetical protein